MFTSLAEYRLLLRQDNADLRLMEYGYNFGLIPRQLYEDVSKRKEQIEKSIRFLTSYRPSLEDMNKILGKAGSSLLKEAEPLAKILKRPEVSIEDFAALNGNELFSSKEAFWRKVRNQVEIEIKYEGFLKRQRDQVEKTKELEELNIPEPMDYSTIHSLSTEGREKLSRIKPKTLGQATRILGVSASDITILMIYLHRLNKS